MFSTIEQNKDYNNTSANRESYLQSFNKITFVDEYTIIIDQKYMIKKTGSYPAIMYSISNMNDYWKSDISFNLNFDRADLEKVRDNPKYQVRFIEFSLWGQAHFLGKLSIKFGYEDQSHAGSEHLAEFFNCKIISKNIEISN
jgi:hypothetical protein